MYELLYMNNKVYLLALVASEKEFKAFCVLLILSIEFLIINWQTYSKVASTIPSTNLLYSNSN